MQRASLVREHHEVKSAAARLPCGVRAAAVSKPQGLAAASRHSGPMWCECGGTGASPAVATAATGCSGVARLLELIHQTGTEAETACMPLEKRKLKSPRRLQHVQLHVRWMWKGQAALHRAAVGGDETAPQTRNDYQRLPA